MDSDTKTRMDRFVKLLEAQQLEMLQQAQAYQSQIRELITCLQEKGRNTPATLDVNSFK